MYASEAFHRDLIAGAGSGPLPKSLGGREIAPIAERLRLNEARSAIVEPMHGEYQVAHNRALDEADKELAAVEPKPSVAAPWGHQPFAMPEDKPRGVIQIGG